jgi:ribosomal protein S18 acetylase RimI-like enzyme
MPTAQIESAACLLRAAEPEDAEFLFRLFAESQEQLSQFLSNEELWRSLVAMQFRGRQMTYSAEYPRAVDSILCVESAGQGTLPVGRLLVDRQPDCWRIVDIAVVAAYRGRGLGGWALKNLMLECSGAAGRLALRVRPENAAQRLYERLGFRAAGEDATGLEMVWSAAR